jgi:hypothetical protein
MKLREGFRAGCDEMKHQNGRPFEIVVADAGAAQYRVRFVDGSEAWAFEDEVYEDDTDAFRP